MKLRVDLIRSRSITELTQVRLVQSVDIRKINIDNASTRQEVKHSHQ